MNKQSNSTSHATAAARHSAGGKRKRKGGNASRKRKTTGLFSGRVPLWWIIIGVLAAGALYIFILVHFFVDPGSFRWNAIYGEGVNPDGFEVRGIDVSRYQENIDWERLRNANVQGNPLRFVFIKATEGTDIIDPCFNENFYQAKQNDIVRGAYHFFSPTSDARRQARFFLRQVHLEAGDLPPVLDVEQRGNLSKQQLQKAVKQWLDIVEQHYGVKPIIYTGYNFKEEYLNDTIFNAYPYWIAHYYVDKLKYKGQWTFWQYTDAGHIDGIGRADRDYVDCNIFNGDLRQLMRLTIQPEEIDQIGLNIES